MRPRTRPSTRRHVAPAVRPTGRAPLSGARLAWLLDEFNEAVRQPAVVGGIPGLDDLLDQLTTAEPESADGARWLIDTDARMSPAMLLRDTFGDADLPLIASQYGEDAHRRGWLRLDRTLEPAALDRVLDRAVAWSDCDRELPELIDEFGIPSVVYGDPALEAPKTLGYAGADRTAPVPAFHFGAYGVLLATRIGENFLDDWTLTPVGETRFH